ncbi:D-glycero-alpha-D-manno-heptose-1,7-bisphosphate 7-phosphatase [Kitasatospora sp. NPDC058397]|uniref:D-glycero-alpha-D-manno-heptose-1,7-bisphosphate 7-phosphatase n=1 Tax=unclassified Kitasatospora TaxID=2633591 RepID=UPI00365BA21F
MILGGSIPVTGTAVFVGRHTVTAVRQNDPRHRPHPERRRKAVFLDRDGTLTEPRHYPSHPAELVLQPGIEAPLLALQQAGYALVVVTNQSGVARGFFTAETMSAMHDRLTLLLAHHGVHLDAVYACPHHPEGTLPAYQSACQCRKPAPGMLHQAAHDLGLDLTRSWMVGDSPSDVAAGQRAGTHTALVGRQALNCPRPDLQSSTTYDVLRRLV